MIDCTATKHGTASAYQNQDCRCDDAKAAQRLYVKTRKLAKLRGQHGRPGMVPTWRAERRFHALARMGYSARDVQNAAWGYRRSHGTLSWHQKKTMGPERFARLDALYQLWSAVPGENQRARTTAVRLNYPAPLDWDNIDDPDEVPHNRTPQGLDERRRERERVRDRQRQRRAA
jgi:hypothetical protein